MILYATNPIIAADVRRARDGVNAMMFWNDMARPPGKDFDRRTAIDEGAGFSPPARGALKCALRVLSGRRARVQELAHQRRILGVRFPRCRPAARSMECRREMATSTFDSISTPARAAARNEAVRVISVSDTAARRNSQTPNQIEHASRPTRRDVGSVIALSMIFASRSTLRTKRRFARRSRCRAPARTSPAA